MHIRQLVKCISTHAFGSGGRSPKINEECRITQVAESGHYIELQGYEGTWSSRNFVPVNNAEILMIVSRKKGYTGHEVYSSARAVTHDNLQQARHETDRLAAANPEKEFFIMVAIEKVFTEAHPVKHEIL